jgi:uncharacterized protein YjbJ (UPF0337 family)
MSEKEVFMNWDQIAGQWKQFSGAVRQEWSKFTDDDLEYIGGTKDKLVGRLQEKYGLAKEEADRRAERWLQAQKETRRSA